MTEACASDEITCTNCGKPAMVTEYWSTSPQRPQTRVLKRQTCCTARPQRSQRWAGNRQPGCPVITEVVREEPLAIPLMISPTPPPKGESMKSDFVSSEEAPGAGRGRMSGEERARIVKLHQAGASAEGIAQQLSRSVKGVQKVLDDSAEGLPEPDITFKVDEVVELLSEIPEAALEPLLGLVRLRRQEKELRQRLAEALSQET